MRCRRDRAEPDGKRGNAVSECGAGDSEGVEAAHFRHCAGRRGGEAMTQDAESEVRRGRLRGDAADMAV